MSARSKFIISCLISSVLQILWNIYVAKIPWYGIWTTDYSFGTWFIAMTPSIGFYAVMSWYWYIAVPGSLANSIVAHLDSSIDKRLLKRKIS